MISKIFRFLLILVVLLAIGLGIYYYLHNAKYYPKTNNAYVKTHVLQIASRLTGTVEKINVRDLQFVKKGDVLFSLDQRPLRIEYNRALSDYNENKKNKVKKNILNISKSHLDKASLELEYSVVRAPEDGYILKFQLRPGSAVTATQPLFSIVSGKDWWVEANFKETDLERVKRGQKATIVVDMYPNHTFHGVVNSVSTGSGASFSLLPAENATGNWVKVTARFQVRINITDPTPKFPLRVGASAEVTIDTKK